ncbi:MAG: polysaccharide deacetylase family protein [Pirellulaceae bacterium]|nr:polysaccharide deacetylase family protein [Pirellulaceae bacterium]
MLVIASSNAGSPNVLYAASRVFDEALGLPWRAEAAEIPDFRIRLEGATGEVRLPDVFFRRAEADWLSPDSLPVEPLQKWDSREITSEISLVHPVVPVIFGAPHPQTQVNSECITLPIDILGSTFFMLSRYEEAVLADRDEHDRFPATASLAYQAGFLDRPIIDEYIEILWEAMKRLWPGLKRKPRSRTIRVTCDVDSPYAVDYSGRSMVRGLVNDLVKQKTPGLALQNLYTRLRALCGNFSGDPHLEKIQWMMDENERAGNRVAFYFLTDCKYPGLDGRYRIGQPVIRKLLRQIYDRGHEIGLHPSYATYLNSQQTTHEAELLRRTLEEEGIPSAGLGGRQHYLRWRTPTTARNWEMADMAYDSTLSYADRAGFRCGTSREFTMYDVEQRRPMKLKQRPLILMECSVIAERYMALGYTDEALAYMRSLKERALSIGGEFTLLWHNSFFLNPAADCFYQDMIQ